MMRILLLLLSALTLLPSGSAVLVEQDKKLVMVSTGDTMKLSCTQDQSNYFNMYWYQQKLGQGLELMVFSTDVNSEDMEKDYKERWSLQRPSVYNSTLTLTASAAEDNAVYFCAARGSTTSAAYFGEGTVVSVLEEGQEPKKPNVSIYRPNKQELKDHNFISLVCVASDFFPEHVKIQWFVNSVKRINVYEPTPQKKGNNSYSTSKRLTLTREEYFNPDSTFRCVAAFLDGSLEASEEIKGETDCGVSKEFYTMYINQGKISYIMILCKSGLYALVVLVLVWRKKGYCALLLKGIADASNLYKPELHG
ncbi:M1-specific T cell receptor beta chain-like isoform X2 [Bufo bufo]|uniref:M1-specific T cell receptor beta chain-like isoform X2 n=1 Tax=Bufo bufo TaxID=8384 RepID=UPI001ABE1D0B|nr:M1-specific T cell receptor beta chain-like isoform X2 [Bufo bufo]